MKLILLLLLITFSAQAADLKINDYSWNLTDVALHGQSKERLFSRMDREFIKPGKSICSNRALMWANDFKKNHNFDTAKIFLFYTKKKDEEISLKTWWYHVAPVINENGKLWVLDAGFPGFVKGPLTKEEWLTKFTTIRNCKEINANETELVELIFKGLAFPHETSYGYYDCYFKVVPHTLWTPEAVAMNLLGRNREGKPINFERPEIDQHELYQSCLEATSTKIGWAFGSSKKKCKEYVGIPEEE
jgi:hypothetical protein